jgi:hypothetical protein
MNELQKHIPNQVGRFDDSFQYKLYWRHDLHRSMCPQSLFEAGHYQNDYYREYTRKIIFTALISGLQYILRKRYS